MSIWAYCADPGDADVILPIVARLNKEKEIILIAKNVAAKMAREKGLALETHCEADSVIEKHKLPELFITGMCSQDKVSRHLIQKLRKAKVPTVALQDFWGSRLKKKWNPKKYRPTFICVNDEVGKKIVKKAWPDYYDRKIKIFGYPSLDKFYGYKVDTEKLKQQLGLTEDWPIVLFAGQIDQTGKVFYDLVSALNILGQPVYLLPRQHPRWDTDALDIDKIFWGRSIKSFKAGKIINTKKIKNIDPLIMLSTVTLSIFSTVLVNAAVLHKPNISILFPKTGMKKFLSMTDGIIDEFPLVDLNCSAKATNRGELKEMLSLSFENKLGLEKNQESVFKIDGKNTQRISDWLLSLIN